MTTFPLAPLRPTFRAAAASFVPDLADAAPATWAAVEETIATALIARQPAEIRSLSLFVRLLDVLAFARHGRPLARLDPARRLRLLRRLERSSFPLLRRGIWGLRTVVFLGYYSDARTQLSLGYRADPRGWAARR